MATDDTEETTGYDIPDPMQVAQQQYLDYEREQQSPNATLRSLSNIRYGLTAAMGGGPQVAQATAIRDRMASILSQANEQSDPNEDPLQKNMRIAALMSRGMVDVSPKIAMQANQQLLKYQQAQQQQALLGVRSQQAQTDLSKSQVDLQEDKLLTGQNVITSSDGTGPIFRTISRFDANGNLRADSDVAQEQAKALQDATAAGMKDPVVMDMNKYAVNKGQLQAAKDKTALEIAQMKAAQAQAQRAQKGFSPSATESNNFYTAADSMHQFATSSNGLVDLFQGMNGMPPKAAATTLKTWLASKAVDLNSLISGGQLSPQDIKSIDPDSTKGPEYTAQVASMAWQLARANFTGRITNQEISQAKEILGGMDANPKTGLQNLSNVISQKYQNWDAYMQDHFRLGTDPAVGQQNMQLHQARAQEGQMLLNKIDSVRKGFGMDPVSRGTLPAAGTATAQDSAAVTAAKGALAEGSDFGASNKPDGTRGVLNGKNVIVKNGRVVEDK